MSKLLKEMILREFINNDVVWCVRINTDVDNEKRVVYITTVKEHIYLSGGGDFEIISKDDIFLNNEVKEKREKFINEWVKWCDLNNYKLKIVQ